MRIGTVISDTLQGWGTSSAYLDGMGVEPETIFEWSGSEEIVVRFKRKLGTERGVVRHLMLYAFVRPVDSADRALVIAYY